LQKSSTSVDSVASSPAENTGVCSATGSTSDLQGMQGGAAAGIGSCGGPGSSGSVSKQLMAKRSCTEAMMKVRLVTH
jgi:hypothetical protein